MEKIKDISEIKIKVLEELARYAYEGTLADNIDEIPFNIIRGVKPYFRCCVYREREIVLQRVRMGVGKLPHGVKASNNSQMVHVIPSACHGCPISRFTVTSNCQNCLSKSCMKACRFDAIVRTPTGVFIDKDKCKKCGACVDECPYNAIIDSERPCVRSCAVNAIDMDENDLAVIDSSKCINCGACIVGCPFKAIGDLSMLVSVVSDIREGKEVYALVAPSIEGQFGNYSMGVIKSAIKLLGFKDVVEVAMGADIVAYREAEELKERISAGEVLTTSCCPSFVAQINKFFPSLSRHISTTVSPMIATARYIKSINPNAVAVFIGPCVAKKQEMLADNTKSIGGVLNFDELVAMMRAKSVDLSTIDACEESASIFGKGFAKSGGVSCASVRALKEQGYNEEVSVCVANGADECKRALLMLKAGKLTDQFIEGMACKGGCLHGTFSSKDKDMEKRFNSMQGNGRQTILEVVTENNLDKINVHK